MHEFYFLARASSGLASFLTNLDCSHPRKREDQSISIPPATYPMTHIPPPQAARLGIPGGLWRLVDAVVKGGALRTPEGAAELFPPVEIAPPSDTPLDKDTAAVLR